ncbi:MCE family protein [Pseudonocardiaceae bacterium YIM PH 21723]|nr:MCE family protein [Pseudonocardiaceae bacterium YIM PH 21723]
MADQEPFFQRNRTMVRLALFIIVGLACASYVFVEVIGKGLYTGRYEVTVDMPDGGGITSLAQVTYRGHQVGKVDSVQLKPDGNGVSVKLLLDNGIDIPASSKAVVAQRAPIAMMSVALEPETDQGPFLAEGSHISPENTGKPIPMETVLVHLMKMTDNIDPKDVRTISHELGLALGTNGDELRELVNDSTKLVPLLEQLSPKIYNISTNAHTVFGTDSSGKSLLKGTDKLPQVAEQIRGLTDQLRTHDGNIRTVLDVTPDFTQRVAELLARSQNDLAVMLANIASPVQIAGVRNPAIKEALVQGPKSLQKLATAVHDNKIHIVIVTTLGPSCQYNTTRRPPTDMSPRDPNLDTQCKPGFGKGQRSVATAPKPPASADPAPGEPQVTLHSPDNGQATSTGQGGSAQPRPVRDNSWTSIYQQGVS